MVGAGSWGTTVASLVAHNVETTLWARRDDLVDEINSRHTNSAYLPSATLPDTLRASSDLDALIAAADVVAMAVPSQGFRDVAARVANSIGATTPVVSLSKGLERSTLMRMSQVLEESMPGRPVAVLSGPNLAREILADRKSVV